MDAAGDTWAGLRAALALWEGDAARAAPATDAALAGWRAETPPPQAVLALARALGRPLSAGGIRAARHLRRGTDPAARAAGAMALSAYALDRLDVIRVRDLLEPLLDDPDLLGPKAADTVRARLTQALIRLGDRAGALEMNAARRGAGRDWTLDIQRAGLRLTDDPDAALALLDTHGGARGETGPAGNALYIAGLLALGRHDAARALATRIAPWPRCAGIARAHLHNMDLAAGRPVETGAVLDRLGLPARGGPGFDAVAFAAADPPRQGPLVSVVMTAFDAGAHLPVAAASVLAQGWRDLELIVVDDASTDATPDRIAALARRDGRVVPLRLDRNGGTYLAKNAGIARARGDFVALCDADDRWTPDHLSRHMDAMLADPDLALSSSRWLRLSDAGRIEIGPTGRIVERCPHSTLFRRAVLDRLGPFDAVRLGADREMVHRVALEYGDRATTILDAVLTLGRRHDASLTTSGLAPLGDAAGEALRCAYRHAWTGWHIACAEAGRVPVNSGRPGDRPYPVPDGIV